MSHEDGGTFIKETESRNAKNMPSCSPPLWQRRKAMRGLGALQLSERRFSIWLKRLPIWRRHSIFVAVEIIDDFGDGVPDSLHAIFVEQAPLGVVLRELQRLEENFIVIFGQRLRFQKGSRLFGRFYRITRKHALIDQFRRRQGWLVAEHDLEELEPVDMPTDHDETGRQGRCQNKADRPPKPRPEGRGGDHRDGGKPGALPMGQWFEPLPDDGLADEKESTGLEDHGPAGRNRRRQNERKYCGDERAHVGDETHDHRQHAPKRRAGNTDEPKPDPDHQSEASIERELRQKKPRQPLSGIIKSCRSALEIAGTRQAHKPVPEILALNQNEYDENHDDTRRREGLDKWCNERRQRLKGTRLRR